ncbi:MAG: biotin/lipoyl-containing protein, partial [Terriglobales bacterium]
MPTDVVMPQMGESIFEGTITKWLKKPGDKVSRDEPLFEISTDKVDAEIPSPTAGVLKEIKVPEGATVQVNTVVGTITAEGEAAGAPAVQPQAAAPATAKSEAAPRAPEPAKTAAKATAGEEQEDESTVLQFPHGQGEEGERIRSSPLVRRIARENNIDLNQVQGTGLGGRITKED